MVDSLKERKAVKIKQSPDEFKKLAGEMATDYAIKYHGCSQALLAAFMEMFGISDEYLLAASSAFVGGSKRCLTCGAVSGGLMVLGLKYGRRRLHDGFENLEASIALGGTLIDRFLDEYGTINCCELTGFDLRDSAQAHAFMDSKEAHEKCNQRIEKTARWVAEIISKTDAGIAKGHQRDVG